jgi:hypothetical protein
LNNANNEFGLYTPKTYNNQFNNEINSKNPYKNTQQEFNQSNNPKIEFSYKNILANNIDEKEMFERFKSSNYVLSLKRMYEVEIDELKHKNDNYNQMIIDMKDSYESKLDSLEKLIYNKNESYNKEINDLESLYEEKLRKLLGEKDLKIKYLSEIVDDLTNKNSNLLSQLEVLNHKYKSFKIYSSEKEKSLEHKIQKKEIEIEELKKYIEMKISHLENKNKDDFLIQNKTNEKLVDK